MGIDDCHTAVYRLRARIAELRRQLSQTELAIEQYGADVRIWEQRRVILSDWLAIVSAERRVIREKYRLRGFVGLLQPGLTAAGKQLLGLVESQHDVLRSVTATVERSVAAPSKHLRRNDRTRDALLQELERLEVSFDSAAAFDTKAKALAEQEAFQAEAERKERAAEQARRRAPQDRLRALAAGVTGRARERASRIRKRLRETQMHCPYCSRGLGTQPHADHIYPVAKGGLSTIANMVLVCAECNNKKAEHTLRAFIQLYNLDREAVEARLAELGKDF